MLLSFFGCRVLLFPYLYFAYSRSVPPPPTALPSVRGHIQVFGSWRVLQVRFHPGLRGAPGGPVAVQPGGRAAVAPAAPLVHADLQAGATSDQLSRFQLAEP